MDPQRRERLTNKVDAACKGAAAFATDFFECLKKQGGARYDEGTNGGVEFATRRPPMLKQGGCSPF